MRERINCSEFSPSGSFLITKAMIISYNLVILLYIIMKNKEQKNELLIYGESVLILTEIEV